MEFDRTALPLNGEPRRAPAGEPHPLVVRSLARMRAEGVRHVLELGCGRLRNLAFLAGNAFAVTGVSRSRRALFGASRALGRRTISAQLIRADMCAQPFAAASFDAIVATEVLHYAPRERLRLAFAEAARVLRPGGLLIGTLPGGIGAEGSGAPAADFVSVPGAPTSAADLDGARVDGALWELARRPDDVAAFGVAPMLTGFAVEQITFADSDRSLSRASHRGHIELLARRLAPQNNPNALPILPD